MISIARTFGAPLTVPGGERRAQHVDAGEPGLQRAFDVRHDVHHVRIALDHHALGDASPCRSAATRPTSLRPRSTSITCSAISFRIGEELGGELLVRLARARRAAACRRSAAASPPSPSLRTRISGDGADDVEIAEVVIEHVRRRIERAQRAVERQRRRRERAAPSAATARPASRRPRRCIPLRARTARLVAVGAELASRLRHRGRRLERDRRPARAACGAAPAGARARCRRRPAAPDRRRR